MRIRPPSQRSTKFGNTCPDSIRTYDNFVSFKLIVVNSLMMRLLHWLCWLFVMHVSVRMPIRSQICTLSVCGQTLNNDGLLSVWFNDEDCLAYVRDVYFLNRWDDLDSNTESVSPLDTAKGQNKLWTEFTLCQHCRWKRWIEITLCQHHRRNSRRGITKNMHSLCISLDCRRQGQSTSDSIDIGHDISRMHAKAVL